MPPRTPRHESITDKFVAKLRAGFLAGAEQVKATPDWPTAQKRMTTITYPYLVAIGRVNDGWTIEEITVELALALCV
jgi:hypothetical protein